MGRGTSSDIVYFEQLGRALSVRGNTKETFEELEKHSVEELTNMCKSRDIPLKESQTKEELIEKLIAPVVIDLTNNYEFIKELENNLKNRIKTLQSNKANGHRVIKIKDATFDIEIVNQDLFEMLRYVSDRLTSTWEDHYKLAKAYFEHHGDLLIPATFATSDGYTFDENGVKLGSWLFRQRNSFNKLTSEQKELLTSIDFTSSVYDDRWLKNYEIVRAYYEHYGNLRIPVKFRTKNGITHDENGVRIRNWVNYQRMYFSKLTEKQQQLVTSMGLVLTTRKVHSWEENYKLAKIYYEHYGDLLIPVKFKTSDGYTYDENGIKLGTWMREQRYSFSKLSPEKQELLKSIGFVLNTRKEGWLRNYELVKMYYEHHGNLNIPQKFTTKNGFTYDEDGVHIGYWLGNQKNQFSNLPKEKQHLLKKIGLVNTRNEQWLRNYELAKIYYEYYGDVHMLSKFKTSDGITYDKNGVQLGRWLSYQIKTCDPDSEHGRLLSELGVTFNVKKTNQEIMDICASNNIDTKLNKTILTHISLEELTSKIEFLKEHNLSLTLDDGKLSEIFSLSNKDMQEKYGISLEELVSNCLLYTSPSPRDRG